MKRNEYRVDVLLSVFNRLGYSNWKTINNIQLLTHTVSGNEIILDTSYLVLPVSFIERKVDDLDISEVYFDSIFDAEINLMATSNPS